MDAASRFRCNYLKQTHGYGAVFRLIPTKIATLEQLGIPPVAKEFAHLRGGLVLVTGPTGSGKSTTLAALIDYINENFSRHIVTIEEPIEFVHDNKRSIITQREVPGDCGIVSGRVESRPARRRRHRARRRDARFGNDFARADRGRDRLARFRNAAHEQRAQDGRSNGGCFSRRRKQPQARAMLANSLRGVLAQLLLKKADGSGRIAVNEILIANAAVSAIIREGATQKLQDVIVSGKAQGMQFMDDAIWALLQQRNRHAARSVYESDRQKSLQTISSGRRAQPWRFRRRCAEAVRKSCPAISWRKP